MIKKIKHIISLIEEGKALKEKDIDEILNNTDYVVVYSFTNSIGHLTLFGKNDIVKQYRSEILEELYDYLYKAERGLR